jgi:hypothetical protein
LKSFEGPVLNCRGRRNHPWFLFKWISHSWNSEQCICNFPKFSFSNVVK